MMLDDNIITLLKALNEAHSTADRKPLPELSRPPLTQAHPSTELIKTDFAPGIDSRASTPQPVLASPLPPLESEAAATTGAQCESTPEFLDNLLSLYEPPPGKPAPAPGTCVLTFRGPPDPLDSTYGFL